MYALRITILHHSILRMEWWWFWCRIKTWV